MVTGAYYVYALSPPQGGPVYFSLFVSLFWGLSVACNLAATTVSGTVGSWWFGDNEKAASVFGRSLTTSLGSVALGSLLVSILRALQRIVGSVRQRQRDLRRPNFATSIINSILVSLDTIALYVNQW